MLKLSSLRIKLQFGTVFCFLTYGTVNESLWYAALSLVINDIKILAKIDQIFEDSNVWRMRIVLIKQ
jgi:hypothetical protein